MKKAIISAISLLICAQSFALEHKFGSGWYEFVSSDQNTKRDELPVSSYINGNLVFFRNDTAYMFKSNSDLDIGTPLVVCPELMELKIEGTFAYDERNRVIYFVRRTGDSQTVIYEATLDGDKWKNVKPLQIKGAMAEKNKIEGSTLTLGRYNFSHPGVKGFHNLCLAERGKAIYFSGDFKSGVGGRDLWYI